MLVLSRKIDERIVLPDYQVVITIVAVEGNRVRLGIAAPGEVAVYREEIWNQICAPTPSAHPRGGASSGEGNQPTHGAPAKG